MKYKFFLFPDLTGAGEALSRRKSFKKTLRESFRRLRKGRSTRSNTNAPTTIETRPVERQIEARPVDDGMGSMVRCLTFAQTFITNGKFDITSTQNISQFVQAFFFFFLNFSSYNNSHGMVGNKRQLCVCICT